MQEGPILILAALGVEAKAAATALALPSPGSRSKLHTPFPRARVYTIGMRGSRLAEVMSRLEVPTAPPRIPVIVVGLAGALDPSLRLGDLVLDAPQAGIVPPTRPGAPAVRFGRIHTADRIIATPAEKKALFEATGAAAVDMEQALVSEAFAARGVPVIGLRAISDTATMSLPEVLPRIVDDLGRPKPAALAMHLLRRPGLIVELNRLGRASSLALRNLSIGIRQLVEDECVQATAGGAAPP